MWLSWNKGAVEVVSERDRRGNPLRTVLCAETGLVRNDPVPDDEELAKFYSEEYRIAYKGAKHPRRRQILRNFRRVADHFRRFRDMIEPAQIILDVGAGSGEFVFLMRKLGKEAVGIEPNKDYSAWCREELGVPVRTVHLEPGLFEGGLPSYQAQPCARAPQRSGEVPRHDQGLVVAQWSDLCRGPEHRGRLPRQIARKHVPLWTYLEFQPLDVARGSWSCRARRAGRDSEEKRRHDRCRIPKWAGARRGGFRQRGERRPGARPDRASLRGRFPQGESAEAAGEAGGAD